MKKLAPKGFVVSGYPRDTADLQSYLDHVARIDGVILLNWRELAIVKQIEFGAKQGFVNLAAAKAELRHFKRHVIPVAEFFDYKQLLFVVILFIAYWSRSQAIAAR